MKCLRKLYGKTIIDSSDSDELSKDYKVELEYYQIEDETNIRPYGIEIIKRNIENNQMNIEEKQINNICYRENDTSRLLEILIANKVTPIAADDVMNELIVRRVI